jgi:hypothetical protein
VSNRRRYTGSEDAVTIDGQRYIVSENVFFYQGANSTISGGLAFHHNSVQVIPASAQF